MMTSKALIQTGKPSNENWGHQAGRNINQADWKVNS
jgi:hypothetical protein